VKVKDGELRFNVEDAFLSLDPVSRDRVAKAIAFDRFMVESVVKMLTTGEVDWEAAPTTTRRPAGRGGTPRTGWRSAVSR
jgi:hypothetical protein